MSIVVDQSEQVANGEVIDGVYTAQTFRAAGAQLNSIAFFMDGHTGTTLAYRVLVTTVVFDGNGFHPREVVFESGTRLEPVAGGMHQVTVDTGNLALNPNQTYAFVIDAVADRDGQESRAHVPYSHVDTVGADYEGGFQSGLLVFSGTRQEHFADDWFEAAGSGPHRDLAFVLTFSNPGVKIDGTRGNDRVDADHRIKGEPRPTALDDRIYGKDGKDRLDGLAGDDLIDGGRNKDKLTGAPGSDSFIFGVSLKEKPDKITDFVSADDTIVLKGKAFKKLDPGVLSDTVLRDVGEAATEADRIVYKANGNLGFDKDGSGGAGIKVFAKLAGTPDITALDIVVA
jgi:Ca2+-binding RTX toxin-like protein